MKIFSSPEADLTCKLANLTFLEDPAPGEESEGIMVRLGLREELPHSCRGGFRCCRLVL